MKRLYIYLFVTISLVQPLFAQDDFGIKVGPNFSAHRKYVPEPYWKARTKLLTGLQLGVLYQKHLETNFSLATEANLSIVGAKASFNLITNGYPRAGDNLNDKVAYLEIPVLLQYHIRRFNLGFGPNLSYKITSKVEDYPEDWPSSRKTSYKEWDLGVNASIRYAITKRIGFTARYNYGLVDVEATDSWRIKNRYLNTSIMYSLK